MIALPAPADLDAVPVEQLPAVLAQLAALQAAVAARLAVAPPAVQTDHLLTIEAAAAELAVTEDWLRRRKHLPFVVRLSDGVVRYSRRGLDAFLAAHRRCVA